MLAKVLGVELNLKHISLSKNDHLTPEFLKLNPQHKIPTFVDGDLTICESRATLIYLVEKYAKNDSLYPKDHQKRAVINQRLYFDMGTLYQRYADYFYPQIKQKLPAEPEKLEKLEEAFKFFDDFLSVSKYSAGDQITIADYALVASFSTIVGSEIDYSRFPNINRWYDLCLKSLPGIEVNNEGIEGIKAHIQAFKEQSKTI